MRGFWQTLKKPFAVLAPMEDVTDSVFRRVVRYTSQQTRFFDLDLLDFLQSRDPEFLSSLDLQQNRPEVLFTEFTNVTGLQWERKSLHTQKQFVESTLADQLDSKESKDRVKENKTFTYGQISHRLLFTKQERPLVAQIWGLSPEDYYYSAQVVVDLGFDGIDINMGCPVKKVLKMGACSALIRNRSLAKEIVTATKEGAKGLPVSIKTRIGLKEIETESWADFLLKECQPDVLTIHGRTVKEQSKVPCHWPEIGKVAALNREIFAAGSLEAEKKSEKDGKNLNKQSKIDLWKTYWFKKILADKKIERT